MNKVKVARDQLLQKLRENREKHVNTFEEVLEAYRQEAVVQLEAHIERIRNGDVAEVSVKLPKPKNYEDEYDRAIAMVEWEQEEVIQLSDYDFDSYVLDNWNWKKEFKTTAMSYNVS